LIIAAAGIGSTSVDAAFMSGNELLSQCDAPASDSKQTSCLGYVQGVVDAYAGHLFCIPAGVTVGQARDIARNFLRAHPESRHYSAADEVGRALIAAFPCENSK
jgi:hypothetical protein